VEILKPAKMVHDLPYVAAQLLRVFQQERVFCTLFLCMMAKQIRTHYVQVRGCRVTASVLDVGEHIMRLAAHTDITGIRVFPQDPLLVVSAVCVLHALVHNSGKMSVRDLRMAARAAASALKTVRLVTCD
jgi:hypothetical protein